MTRSQATFLLLSALLATPAFSDVNVGFSPQATAPAPVTTLRTVVTTLAKIERPSGPNEVYGLYSTADGRVYTVTPTDANRDVTTLLDWMAQGPASEARKPVSLLVQVAGNDDEVIAVSELSPAEAATYGDDLSAMTTGEILEQLDGADATRAVPANAMPEAASPAAVPAAIQEARRHGYEPSVLATFNDAQALYNLERALNHDSQCHNRALVWSYEMYLYRGIRSMKVMMFFSSKFQKTYVRIGSGFLGIGTTVKPYKWWYHTAPYVYVGNQEVVLDKEFLKRAVTMDDWTYFFMSEFIHEWTNVLKEQGRKRDFNGYVMDGDDYVTWRRGGGDRDYYIPVVDRLTREQSRCKVIRNYREFREENGDAWCMVRKVPMYYHQPSTIEALDCDPTRDFAPNRNGERLRDGRLKYPCFHGRLLGWDKKAIERAYRDASPR